MVHDLTANQDFQSKSKWDILRRIRRNHNEDELTSPYEEIVLTGTAYDREHKRYILDYESGKKDICERCGNFIGNKPWDSDSSSLCPICSKWLEWEQKVKDGDILLHQIIDENFNVKVKKPWDIKDSRDENAIDNVLLWD